MKKQEGPFRALFLVLICPFVLYIIAAVFLGLIQHEKNLSSRDSRYLVYVSSGDIHTEFVLPVKNDLFDFNSVLPIVRVFPDTAKIKFVSIGWGSREFFFETKNWKDLKLSVVLKTIFLFSESALHVEYLEVLPQNQPMFPLQIDQGAYQKLVSFILRSFALDENHRVQQLGDFSYYGNDRFFKGHKTFHIFRTCNEWTNEGLEEIGWRRPFWSPFKFGVEMALRKN